MQWSLASAGYPWKAFRCGAPHGGGLFPFTAWAALLPYNRSVPDACRFPHASLDEEVTGDTVSPLKEGDAILSAATSFYGSHADMLLGSLPPIVHIRKESDKAAMRWWLERMREELRDPQPVV